MAKVSIIIPVYNAEKYIENYLDSIIDQSFKDYEVILINDGSTDNSLDKIEKYSLNRKNFQLFITDNGGAAAARNVGLDVATGKYIKFIDADDSLYSNASLETMVSIADEYNLDTVIGKYHTYIDLLRLKIRLGDAGNTSGLPKEGLYQIKENKSVPFKEMPNVGNKLFSREIIGDLRFPNRYKWEDLALVPALIARSENFFYINRPVYSYRIGLYNTSVKDALFANDIFQFFEVFEMLKNNLGDVVQLYEEELKKLYAVHGSIKYLISSLWINVTPSEKRKIFRDYINVMELMYPTYKDNELYREYLRLPYLKLLKKHVDLLIGNFERKSNIDELKPSIEADRQLIKRKAS